MEKGGTKSFNCLFIGLFVPSEGLLLFLFCFGFGV